MGIDADLSIAFAKAQQAVGYGLPLGGHAFISVKNKDKRAIIFIAKKLVDLGFQLIATHGTAKVLRRNGMEVTLVSQYWQRSSDHPRLCQKSRCRSDYQYTYWVCTSPE